MGDKSRSLTNQCMTPSWSATSLNRHLGEEETRAPSLTFSPLLRGQPGVTASLIEDRRIFPDKLATSSQLILRDLSLEQR